MPRPLPNPSAKRSRAGSKRRAAGWMLLTLGLLVAAVWVTSGWWGVSYARGEPNWFFACNAGRLIVEGGESPGDRPMKVFQHDIPFAWRVDAGRGVGRRGGRAFNMVALGYSVNTVSAHEVRTVEIALWPLPLLLCTTGGLALWSGRRARRRALEGHCPTCGYNLAGLNRDAGVCPECGKAQAVP